MSRIDTALKPWVENSVSAEVRIASRILGLRVMGSLEFSLGVCFPPFLLYRCTNYQVQSTNNWVAVGNVMPAGPDQASRESGMAGRRQIMIAVLMVAAALCAGSALAADPDLKQILAPS